MLSNFYSKRLVSALAITTAITCASYYLYTYRSSIDPFREAQAAQVVPTEQAPRRRKKVIPREEVEVCLSDIASVRAVSRTSIASVELCCNRIEGGVTPSLGLIEQTVDALRDTDISVNVLIRPRPGNFVYSDDEVRASASTQWPLPSLRCLTDDDVLLHLLCFCLDAVRCRYAGCTRRSRGWCRW